MLRLVSLIVGLAAQGTPNPPASAAPPASGPEARYEVFLLTMDQGDAVWERFGHNAILIRDLASGDELAWNWGLFDFDDADFLPRFLRGSMLYEMGPVDPRALLASYAAADRTVYRNRIHLTQAEARALDEFVRWNYEPENRAYLYHYFRDNCSTRLRDALDLVLGGTLRDAFAGRVTPRSYRWHTRRLVQEVAWVDQGLSFLLGTRGDLPRTEWEAMFIPMELLRHLEGVERPGRVEGSPYLLGPRETLYRAARPPAPESPPGFSLLWPLLGLGIAGALGVLATRADRHRWAGWGLALGVSLWGIFSAALGGILVMAWLTDHDFIQWNVNLLHLSPAGILLAGTSLVAVARPGGRAGAGAFAIALAIAAISVLGVLLEATPWIDQGNGEVLAVALPANLAAAWALGIRARGSR